MQSTIAPGVFARIMSLPLTMRLDLLEFLGSTPMSQSGIERAIRILAKEDGPRLTRETKSC